MTATRTASSSGGSGSTLAGIYDVTSSTYGATGNGTTDDTTAVQAAITAAKAAGGTVYFPPGTYKITTTLDCSGTASAWRMTGAGAGDHFNTAKTTLVYTPSTGNLLNLHSAAGFELDHLRFEFTSATYSGDLIDLDGGPLASDCTNWHIHHCSAKGTASTTARSIVRLNKAIIGQISNCHFGSATNAIRVGDPAGSYVVSVTIGPMNTFNNCTDSHIGIGSADAENIVIEKNVFEAGSTTPGIKGLSGNATYAMQIKDNWFGDASDGTVWIQGPLVAQSNAQWGTISGNRMATPGPTGFHFVLQGPWVLQGNTCESGTIFKGTTLMPILIGNCFNTSDSPGIWETLEPSTFTAIGNVCPGTKFLTDTFATRQAFGSRGGTGSMLPAAATGAHDELVVGASSVLMTDTGRAGALYSYLSAGNAFATVLQAPSFAAGREVQLVAGTTPAPVVRVSDAKVGFYNVAPVAQAARAGQLTDSTGGTVSSTLAAGITDTVAKNAIASLAAKVNALETIIHNLGLSA